MLATRQARIWAGICVILVVLLAATLVTTWQLARAGEQPAEGAIRAGIALEDFAVVVPSHPVRAHEPIRFDVTNNGAIPHDLIIAGVAGTELLEPGENAVLDLGSLTPGVYALHCGVEGHDAAGMRAELRVIDAIAEEHEAHDH